MGASHAAHLAAGGARVVLADILDDAGAQTAAAIGNAAIYQHLDVRDEEQWANVVAATIRRFGQLDALVNNAGINVVSPLADQTMESWNKVLEINLTGTLR
ncbi:SDR family NAD(P)-dependent oxidoreductase [Saccharomonospora sp. NPDC046836]|uniref:SDR family NAD(P)-dependent oxidoreductase n=1 Tax=Saccharomonospora sp. NPDC046836 TaxID=3156921 RepID=UPI0034036DE8